jgi:hypothetical protein
MAEALPFATPYRDDKIARWQDATAKKGRKLMLPAFQTADKVIFGIFLAPPGRNLTFLHLV